MFLQFLPYGKVTQSLSLSHTHTHYIYIYIYKTYTYIHTIFHHVSTQETGHSSLYSRTPLLIHPKCNRLHLPTPNSPSIPLPSIPSDNHKTALHVHDLFLLCRYVHLCHVLDSKSK